MNRTKMTLHKLGFRYAVLALSLLIGIPYFATPAQADSLLDKPLRSLALGSSLYLSWDLHLDQVGRSVYLQNGKSNSIGLESNKPYCRVSSLVGAQTPSPWTEFRVESIEGAAVFPGLVGEKQFATTLNLTSRDHSPVEIRCTFHFLNEFNEMSLEEFSQVVGRFVRFGEIKIESDNSEFEQFKPKALSADLLLNRLMIEIGEDMSLSKSEDGKYAIATIENGNLISDIRNGDQSYCSFYYNPSEKANLGVLSVIKKGAVLKVNSGSIGYHKSEVLGSSSHVVLSMDERNEYSVLCRNKSALRMFDYQNLEDATGGRYVKWTVLAK